MLTLEGKKTIVNEMAAVASGAVSAIVAEYRGLTVGEITELRQQARAQGVYVKVVRNTLARRALAQTEHAVLEKTLVGPTILAFSKAEPSAAARLVRDFAKKHDAFRVKALSLQGQLYGNELLDKIASLPTRNEALAKLLSVVQAPLVKWVGTVQAPHAKLVRVLAAYRDKRQSNGSV